MTDEQKQKIKDYQKQYRENLTDEQKQKYRNNKKQCKENMTDEEKQKYIEAKNKRDRDRYNKMTDEEKQKHEKKYKDLPEKTKKKRLSKTIYRKYDR